MRAIRKRKTPRGFSLVEVLIVIAILGLLSVVVMPLAGKALRRSRAQSVISSLNRELASARLQAVKRGVQVVTEISTVNGTSIHLKSFEDRNPDFKFGTYVPSGGGPAVPEVILAEYTADSTFHIWIKGGNIDDLTTGILFNTYGGSASGTQQRIVFLPSGALVPPTANGNPTIAGGRGIYFADFRGLNFFRITVYSNVVARSRIEKWVNSTLGYTTGGWNWL